MFASILVLLPPPVLTDHDFPAVCLTDARAFGVDAVSCRCIWQLASRHEGVMAGEVRSWNHPDVYALWVRECEWRARCWDRLDDVLYCQHLTPRQKLRSLDELRGLLGDEDYYAGRMPDPLPSYRR